MLQLDESIDACATHNILNAILYTKESNLFGAVHNSQLFGKFYSLHLFSTQVQRSTILMSSWSARKCVD